MRPTRLSPPLLAALLLAAASATACKSSSAETPDGTCTAAQLGAACAAAADCCSGNCQDGALGRICVQATCAPVGGACSVPSDCCGGACVEFTCQDPSSCGGVVGDTCLENGDCCTGSCAGPIGQQVCVNPAPGGCKQVGDACTGSAECCQGECGAGGTCVLPAVRCLAGAAPCTAGSQCCSANCAAGNCTAALFCGASGATCDSSADCCSLRCVGGACASEPCRATAKACSAGDQCCSGVCQGGACAPLGGSATCKTLGESCGAMAECCSTNCAGGACMPSSPVGGAEGEICYRDDDCASGICGPATRPAGGPGRCVDSPGSCGLDGYPCTSDSNCCTRKCVDLGTGARVCQPSGGCRMTGNYCDSTSACCGGTNEANPAVEGIYGIYCDGVGTNPGHPEYDPSKTDSRTCTGGQGCNPPGNICGYKASQNCCYDGGGSGKAVCKPDSGGIERCFGGPVNATCPTGWDANDPDCCKAEGAVCQFRDQCCGGMPCVPDDAGVLRCTNASSCLPTGTRGCDVAAEECCPGTTCENVLEVGFVCAPAGCTGAACGECRVVGNSCTTDTQCCSGVCDEGAGLCRAPCVTDAGPCTRNDDCCTGLACSIPDGRTSGACTASGGGGGGEPTCSATGQSCQAAADCCLAGDECTGGVCVTPAPVCVDLGSSCATLGDCCAGLSCVAYDLQEALQPCGAAGTSSSCFCDQVSCDVSPCEPQCAAPLESCSTQVGCCSGYCGPVGDVPGSCASADPADCECKTAG